MSQQTWNRRNRDKLRAWLNKDFIAWDGEGVSVGRPPLKIGGMYFDDTPRLVDIGGVYIEEATMLPLPNYTPEPQKYILLANSIGTYIDAEEGLGTWDCFNFMLDVKQENPHSTFVGFGFNYDVNQMLRDIPVNFLEKLLEKGWIHCFEHYIEWRPGKHFLVKHKPSKRSFIIYDVFGFFQASFIEACTKYLPDNDLDLALIKKGKAARSFFEYEELDEFILPYNQAECSMLVRMMDMVKEDFVKVGIYPDRWHGPGAVANKVLAKYEIPIVRTKRVFRQGKVTLQHATQYAYAGGRFEQFQMGRHNRTMWEYDIHSAYPAGFTQVPDLSTGYWEYVQHFEPDTFGVFHIEYNSMDAREGYPYYYPEPFFCRHEHGAVSYPPVVNGWYWTPEAQFAPHLVTEGYIFRESSTARPFSFIKGMYEQRRLLKSQGSSTERALKLILNSLYGKTAQRIGGKDDAPRWHQLEYAGFVTSYTRAQIYRAILLNPSAVIAAETDAIFTTQPLDLDIGPSLGQWEEKVYDEITYLQSGFYYAVKDGTVTCRYRGMDGDRNTHQPVGLPYEKVLDFLQKDHWEQQMHPLSHISTRFNGLALSLHTHAVWRAWERNLRAINLDAESKDAKRRHLREMCPACAAGHSLYDTLHPLAIGQYGGSSHAHSLPWIKEKLAPPLQTNELDISEWMEIESTQ